MCETNSLPLFLADHTLVSVELFSQLLSICRTSVTDELWLNGAHTGFQMTHKSMTVDDLEASMPYGNGKIAISHKR